MIYSFGVLEEQEIVKKSLRHPPESGGLRQQKAAHVFSAGRQAAYLHLRAVTRQGGYGHARYTDGSTEHFLFAGVGQDTVFEKATGALYGSHVTGDSWMRNQFGFNVDGGVGGLIGLGGGLGLGVNTDSLTSCVDHHFH